jgi:hypothetical protein
MIIFNKKLVGTQGTHLLKEDTKRELCKWEGCSSP